MHMRQNEVKDGLALIGPSVLDQGQPDVDPRSFRKCLGQFGTGVTVIATDHDGQLAGTTVGSFSSLSLDPPLVLWSIAKSARSAAIFQNAVCFTINVLAEDQIHISQHFSSSSDKKFASIQSIKGHNGCPVLPGIVALFECRREATLEGGDHWIIIGKVQRFVRHSGKPLLFVQSKYAVHQIHPLLESSSAAPVTSPNEHGATAELSSLILNAARLRLGGFEIHRRAEGLNHLQTRVLFGLLSNAGQTADDLAQEIFATPIDSADAIAELVERGLLYQDSKEKVSLTETGREKCEAIRVRNDRYEAECLAGFGEGQVRTVRDFLKAFVRKFKTANSTP